MNKTSMRKRFGNLFDMLKAASIYQIFPTSFFTVQYHFASRRSFLHDYVHVYIIDMYRLHFNCLLIMFAVKQCLSCLHFLYQSTSLFTLRNAAYFLSNVLML